MLGENFLQFNISHTMIKRNIFAEEYNAPELDIVLVNAEFGVVVSSEYGDIDSAPSWDYGEF